MNKISQTELTPDILAETTKSRKEEIERVLREKESALQSAPEGTIRIVDRGRTRQYYHISNPSDTEGVYLKRKHNVLAEALAQKDYDSKLICELRDQVKTIDKILDGYHPERIDEVYISLHNFRKPLVCPAALPDEEYMKRWRSVDYEKKAFDENAPDFYTANDERVRSKSEILIADALSRRNIPYRYEYPIHIPKFGVVHPDFTCLNVRKREEYIWEHNGLMSDSDYLDYAIRKIEKYTLADYYPGKNLILTFESSACPLSSRIIEKTINNYLL